MKYFGLHMAPRYYEPLLNMSSLCYLETSIPLQSPWVSPWKELIFHFNKFAIVESLSMSIFPSPTRELEKRLTLRMRSITPTTNFLLNLAVSDVIPGMSPPMVRLGRESIGSQELTSTSQFPPTKLQFTSSRPPEQQML